MSKQAEWRSLKSKSNSDRQTLDMFADVEDAMDVLDAAAVRIGAAAAAAAGGAGPENPNLTDNWDDAEGYYRVQTGEVSTKSNVLPSKRIQPMLKTHLTLSYLDSEQISLLINRFGLESRSGFKVKMKCTYT